MHNLIAYTDGACSGNPGPGGWGVVIQAKSVDEVVKQRSLKGGAADTTNNRMELMAAISALEALDRPSQITIVTNGMAGRPPPKSPLKTRIYGNDLILYAKNTR